MSYALALCRDPYIYLNITCRGFPTDTCIPQNAAEAHRCRGADWTFDAHGLLELLTRIRTAPLCVGAPSILAPSFDHALKDPTPDSIAIAASDRVVLVEGLYLHSGAPVWRDMAALFDHTWWVSCPIDVAMERVARRHVAAGICAWHSKP
jgi:pantothenate kinase